MWFGLLCHTLSTVLILMADGYWMMYIGTFTLALGSGTVEAYINPVVVTLFRRDKTKWLNILHAGWPGGLVFGGILAIMLGGDIAWKVKIALILIPTVIYAFMLWSEKFPVHERVAAGVSYRDMLREVGSVGALIISTLVVMEIGRVFGLGLAVVIGLIVILTGIYAAYTRSFGRPLFILFLLIMMPLATTELGVDSWITALMSVEMANLGIAAAWVLVYTSAIMMVLRFFAGPIVHKLSPLGLLAASAAIACLGLLALSASTGVMILLAATLYGVGKTFFWPTTLGVVAEQFPKGGALTLNAVAGVGMLAVGIVGAPFLGYVQDISNVDLLAQTDGLTTSYEDYVAQKSGLFGEYQALDVDSVADAPPEDASIISTVQLEGQKDALQTVAIFPAIMLLCYLGLIFYFKSKGGYKPVDLTEEDRRSTPTVV
jgi:MFS family permease